jgi:hypothetical protein
MAKSIRISDRLYESAASNAALMHRSLAQQIEHWAALGHAFEADAAVSAVVAAALKHMHAVDAERVHSGLLHARALPAIPVTLARGARVHIHRKALEDFDVDR